MSSTVNTDKLLTFVAEKFETNELNNESQKFRKVVEIFNVKFVIDND